MLSKLLRMKARAVSAPTFVASAATQNSTTGATLVISKPTGTVDGDIMFAWMGVNGNWAETWSGDTGWTELVDSVGNKAFRLACKLASGEGSSYTFTSNSASAKAAGGIVTWRGGAFDVCGAGNGGANPIVCDSVAATANLSILLAFYGASGLGVTLTSPPSGMTALVSDSDGTNGPSWFIYYQAISAGASGTKSATFSSATGSCGITAVIKPT